MGVTVFVTAMLGFINVFKASFSVIGETFTFSGNMRAVIFSLALLTLIYGVVRIRKERIKLSS